MIDLARGKSRPETIVYMPRASAVTLASSATGRLAVPAVTMTMEDFVSGEPHIHTRVCVLFD